MSKVERLNKLIDRLSTAVRIDNSYKKTFLNLDINFEKKEKKLTMCYFIYVPFQVFRNQRMILN